MRKKAQLYQALKDGDLNTVKDLLPTMPDVVNYEGLRPLHIAVEKQQMDIVRWLLQQASQKQYINANSQYGCPLHLAVKAGNLDLVKLLVEDGADANLTYKSEHDYDYPKSTKPYQQARLYTAIALAIALGHKAIFLYLLRHRTNVAETTLNNLLAFCENQLEPSRPIPSELLDYAISRLTGCNITDLAVRKKTWQKLFSAMQNRSDSQCDSGQNEQALLLSVTTLFKYILRLQREPSLTPTVPDLEETVLVVLKRECLANLEAYHLCTAVQLIPPEEKQTAYQYTAKNIAEKLTQLSEGHEYIVPVKWSISGSGGHALYVAFMRRDGFIYIRTDNLNPSEKIYHQVAEDTIADNKMRPCILGGVPYQSFQTENLFYLEGLIKTLKDSVDREVAIAQIYHRNCEPRLQNLKEENLSKTALKQRCLLFGFKQQAGNNCFIHSHLAGLYIRLYVHTSRTGDDSLYEWLSIKQASEITDMNKRTLNLDFWNEEIKPLTLDTKERLRESFDKAIGAELDELTLYVPPQGKAEFSDQEEKPVLDEVNAFFRDDNNQNVLLVLGDAGIGKTLLLYHLSQKLWEEHDQDENQPVPIFIRLSSHYDVQNSVSQEDMVASYLQATVGLSKKEIAELKANESFIFLLDGYDEINWQEQEPQNFYQQIETRWEKEKFKLIITCRSQALTELGLNYKASFCPRPRGAQSPESFLAQIILQSFTSAQREQYVRSYLAKNEGIWSVETYLQYIKKLSGLEQAMNNPLLLKFLLIALPRLAKNLGIERGQMWRISRYELYQSFTNEWFSRQKYKLLEQNKLGKDDPIEENFLWFSRQFAIELYRHEQLSFQYVKPQQKRSRLRPKKPSKSEPSEPEWQKLFNDTADPELPLIRSGCLLKQEGENAYSFIHKSLWEYFVADDILDNLSHATEQTLNEVMEILNIRLINNESSIIEFIATEIKKDLTKQAILFAILNQSREDTNIITAAANSITLLNAAKVSFSRRNLHGIRICNARLDRGIFDGTNLRGADLRGVSLRQAWLNHADLSKSNLQGVNFGQGQGLTLQHGELQHDYFPDYFRQYVRFSPDGKWIATAGEGVIKLWCAVSGKHQYTLSGFDSVRCCEHRPYMCLTEINFSYDSKLLVFPGARCGAIQLWDVNSRKNIRTFEHVSAYEHNLMYAIKSEEPEPTCKKRGFYLYRNDKSDVCVLVVHDAVWDERFNLTQLAKKQNHVADIIDSIIWPENADSKTTLDSTLEDFITSKCEFPHESGRILTVAFSPDGKLIVSGDMSELKIWETVSGRCLHTFLSPLGVSSVVFSPNGKWLASIIINEEDYESKNAISLWDTATWQRVHKLKIGPTDVYSTRISFSPDSQTLAAVTSYSERIIIWDIISGNCLRTLKTEYETTGVFNVAFSPDGKLLACADRSGRIYLFETLSGQYLTTLYHGFVWYYGFNPVIRSISFSPDGKKLASADRDGTVRVTNLEIKIILDTYIHKLQGHMDEIWQTSLSPDSRLLATVASNELRVWELSTGECLYSQDSPLLSAAAFSPNGRWLAISLTGYTMEYNRKGLVLLETFSWKEINNRSYNHGSLHDWDYRNIHHIAFSQNGQYVSTLTWSRSRLYEERVRKRVWGIKSGNLCYGSDDDFLGGDKDKSRLKKCGPFIEHIVERIESPKSNISPDGKYKAVVNQCTVQIWYRHSLQDEFYLFKICGKDYELSASDIQLQGVKNISNNNWQLLQGLGAQGQPSSFCEQGVVPNLQTQGFFARREENNTGGASDIPSRFNFPNTVEIQSWLAGGYHEGGKATVKLENQTNIHINLLGTDISELKEGILRELAGHIEEASRGNISKSEISNETLRLNCTNQIIADGIIDMLRRNNFTIIEREAQAEARPAV